MNTSMQGKRILVTAGAAGIGMAITQAFVAAGAQVHICDIDQAALDRARAALPAVSQSRTDVSDRTAVDAMFDDLAIRWTTLDVLVNNAGVAGPTAKIEAIDPGDWERTLAVCMTGMFLCTRRAMPMIKAAGGGSVVNLSSAAGRLGFPLRSPYAAAKFGVVGFTESLAIEAGPDNVRVNAILPGVVAGERQDRVIAAKAAALGISVEEQTTRLLSRVSMRKMVSADDIANMILFICSPAGENISGQSLAVCGNVETLA